MFRVRGIDQRIIGVDGNVGHDTVAILVRRDGHGLFAAISQCQVDLFFIVSIQGFTAVVHCGHGFNNTEKDNTPVALYGRLDIDFRHVLKVARPGRRFAVDQKVCHGNLRRPDR